MTLTKFNIWRSFDYNLNFSGSINPIIEEPAVWYGEVPIVALDALALDALALDALALDALAPSSSALVSISNADKYDEEQDIICSLCYCIIIDNDQNIIKLACGHSFHDKKILENECCIGVSRWISMKKQCPVCRTSINSKINAIPIIITF